MKFSGSEKDFLKILHQKLSSGSVSDWRDDCIVRDAPNSKMVYSLDRPERIRFTSSVENDFHHFGRWSASLVASDVIAEGCIPSGISFDIGTDQFVEERFFWSWVEGVQQVCEEYSMKYEGGNIGNGSSVIGMAYGFTQKPIRRCGAQIGDLMIATFPIGIGWSKRVLAAEGHNEIVESDQSFRTHQDEPWINLEAFQKIWEMDCITSGMDLTDGIIEFAYEVLEQNNLGVLISRPSAVSEVLLEPGYDTPMAHGWTIKREQANEVIQTLKSFGVECTIVGEVISDPNVYIDVGERNIQAPRYWDDIFEHRGSVERWKSDILALF